MDMANKLKEFLFPNKERKDYDTTTIEVEPQMTEKEVVSKPTVTTFNAQTATNSNSPAILTPKSFAEVETVAIELLDRKSVIVDLTETDIDEARRICDFLNGVTYAINGSVQKVAKLVYLFVPQSR